MKNILSVNAKAFAAAAFFIGHKDVRKYICGVHVKPNPDGGVILSGTDGYIAAMVFDRTGQCTKKDGLIVSVTGPALTKMRQAKMVNTSLMEHENDLIVCSVTGREPTDEQSTTFVSQAHLLEGRYPDLSAIIPNKLPECEPSEFTFDATLFQPFINAAKVLSVPKNAVSIRSGLTPSSAAMVLFGPPKDKSLHIRGVMMPLNSAASW